MKIKKTTWRINMPDEKISSETQPEQIKTVVGFIAHLFENLLWSTRFLVLFAVISSLVAALILFIIGSVDMFSVLQQTWDYYINGNKAIDIHTTVVTDIIGAIDIYLIAVVLIIFSFGLYELFISDIAPAKESETSGILQVHSLDALKDKIAQVVVMALIVKYFQIVLSASHHFTTALEMAYLAISISALAISIYLLHKTKKTN